MRRIGRVDVAHVPGIGRGAMIIIAQGLRGETSQTPGIGCRHRGKHAMSTDSSKLCLDEVKHFISHGDIAPGSPPRLSYAHPNMDTAPSASQYSDIAFDARSDRKISSSCAVPVPPSDHNENMGIPEVLHRQAK